MLSCVWFVDLMIVNRAGQHYKVSMMGWSLECIGLLSLLSLLYCIDLQEWSGILKGKRKLCNVK